MSALVEWDPTNLDDEFAATIVQRWQEAIAGRYPIAGWFDISRTLTESIGSYLDRECRYNRAELYRVIPEDVDGIRGIPSAEVSITVPAPANRWTVTSNVDPSIERILWFDQADVELPDRVAVNEMEGRFGRRIHRADNAPGEQWTVPLHLGMDGELGPELWRDLAETLRTKRLHYLCVLDGLGNRWFYGTSSIGHVAHPKTHVGTMPATFAEVTNTPDVVVVP